MSYLANGSTFQSTTKKRIAPKRRMVTRLRGMGCPARPVVAGFRAPARDGDRASCSTTMCTFWSANRGWRPSKGAGSRFTGTGYVAHVVVARVEVPAGEGSP